MSDSDHEIDVVEDNPKEEKTPETVPTSQDTKNMNAPQNPNDLLMWSIQNSSGNQVDKNRLMKPEEFAKVMEQYFPSPSSIVENALNKLKENDLSDTEIQDNLDAIARICTPYKQAQGFAEMGGFDVIVNYLNNHDPETRRGTAMIIALCSQNNKKVQLSYNKSPGMKVTLQGLTGETDIKAAQQKLVMISCLLRNCVENRIDFYKNEGFKYLLDYCSKWPQQWSSFAFMIAAILEENNPNDQQEMNRIGLRIIAIQNRQHIKNDNLLKIIITKLL